VTLAVAAWPLALAQAGLWLLGPLGRLLLQALEPGR